MANLGKIRILFFNFYGRLGGGAENSLYDLMTSLDESKFEVILLLTERGAFYEKCKHAGITPDVISFPAALSRVNRWGFLSGLLKTLMSLFPLSLSYYKLFKYIYKKKVDIIHCNHPKAFILGSSCAIVFKKKIIWHVRDIFKSGSLAWFFLSLFGYIKNLSVICISKAVRRSLPDSYYNKSYVVYNGISEQRFCPVKSSFELRREIGLDGEAVVVLTAGRIVPWKRQRDLLEMIKIIHRKKPQLRLIICGESLYWRTNYMNELQDYVVKNALTSIVTFLNYKHNIADYINMADIVALPSDNEPFGRVLIEAMCLHKCVIAANSGGVPEIVRHQETGFLYPTGNIGVLTEGVLLLADHPKLRTEMGEKGYQVFRENFTLQAHILQVESLYEHIC